MQHYIKNLYSFDHGNPTPTFIGQREEVCCPLCHKRIVLAVPTTGINWQKVAEDYKSHANTLWGEFNGILNEHGMPTILRVKIGAMLRRINSNFGNQP